MATWILPPPVSTWVNILSSPLHGRLAWRLAPLLTGMLFAMGRRTVASWLRANSLGRDYKPFYRFIGCVGRSAGFIASMLLRLLVRQLPLPEGHLVFAIDDTPTKRAGPMVEGAGIHHNPTPGPADQKFLYGHVWVTISWILMHPSWGVIGLPLRALLYVRKKNLDLIAPCNQKHFPFRTKLELAADLVQWVTSTLGFLRKPIWIVADGAYAKRPFVKAVLESGAVLVSRLRKDANLRSVPTPPRPGQSRRGRKPKYGKESISLAKRAGHRGGWQQAEFKLYGKTVTKTFKTFLATYEVVGGTIRVVLVREADGWVAFFCTDPEATVAQILEAVADRSTIEQNYHDIKEVHGAGQQQVRHIFANLAVFNLILWLHTLIELWAWDQPAKKLRDRSDSPWDDPDRRPSHADRRNALRREIIEHTFSAARGLAAITRKTRDLLRRLVKLVT